MELANCYKCSSVCSFAFFRQKLAENDLEHYIMIPVFASFVYIGVPHQPLRYYALQQQHIAF
jgi:hypothetical protein